MPDPFPFPELATPSLNARIAQLEAERDRLRQALSFIAVGDLPGQYTGDFLDCISDYAKDVLAGGGALQVFPGTPATKETDSREEGR